MLPGSRRSFAGTSVGSLWRCSNSALSPGVSKKRVPRVVAFVVSRFSRALRAAAVSMGELALANSSSSESAAPSATIISGRSGTMMSSSPR